MITKNLDIRYREYASVGEMDARDQALVAAARQAQKSSYAPYSHFNVGAAVLLANGVVVPGSNQENAATPSGLCAERTAMFAAGAQYPGVPMVGLAVVGGPDHTVCDDPATPCGACRQVMAEYQKLGGQPMRVILAGEKAIWKFDRVDDILPLIFNSL